MSSCPVCARSAYAGPVDVCVREGCPLRDETQHVTLTDGTQVYPEHRDKITEGPRQGQQKDYVVLSEVDRAKGFVRPVRTAYVHEKCGTKTTMALSIAETYAREPGFYGGTFCATCRKHYPVGETGEFVWDDGSKVGT